MGKIIAKRKIISYFDKELLEGIISYSGRQLAVHLGVHRNTVFNWTRGKFYEDSKRIVFCIDRKDVMKEMVRNPSPDFILIKKSPTVSDKVSTPQPSTEKTLGPVVSDYLDKKIIKKGSDVVMEKKSTPQVKHNTVKFGMRLREKRKDGRYYYIDDGSLVPELP